MATPTQIRRRGRWSLIIGAMFAFAALAAVAYADDIVNSVPGTAKIMALNEGGPTGSTQLTVTPQGSDGKPGCNLTGSTTLVVSVTSSDTSVATVSPTSLTFGSCGDVKTVTVTPHDAGSANVTLTQTSNTTDGTFNLAPAAFTVNVAPPPNTAPNVSVTGVTHGAIYAKGSVPTAGCSVEDVEDGNSTPAASLSPITGTYASDGLGSQTATCTYTDAGGLTETVTATYTIYDASAPSIGYTLNPAAADGSNGWYKSNVSLAWNVADLESPNSLQKTGCVDQSVTEDQQETTYSCSASSAGGSAGPVSVVIKRDATAPTLSSSPTSLPNLAGWYKADVTIDWTCNDETSGLATICPADSVISDEGIGLTASSGSVSDLAGNSTTATSAAVKIDKTPPNAPTAGVTPAANAAGWHNSAPVTVSFTAAGDGGSATDKSGVAECSDSVVYSSQSSTTAGDTASGTCTDVAGNTSAATTRTVKIDLTAPVITASAKTADNAAYTGAWTNQTVTVSFTCEDALSGIAGSCPASVPVASDTALTGQNVSSGSVFDVAGNSASSNTINVKVDKTNPTVSVAGFTAGAKFNLGSALPTVSCSRSDALSGIDAAGSTGPTITSDTRNANGVGSVTYQCGGRDNAGNTANDSKTLTVVYGQGAVLFLQPINNTGHDLSNNPDVSTFKAGSTVPVKVQIKTASGTIIQPLSALWITPQKGAPTTQAIDETVYSDPATSGASYNWNASDQFSQYNWGTPKIGAGFYWLIGVKLDDGQTYKVYISLR